MTPSPLHGLAGTWCRRALFATLVTLTFLPALLVTILGVARRLRGAPAGAQAARST